MSNEDCKLIPRIVQGQDKELNVQILKANNQAKDLSTVTFFQSSHPQVTDGDYLVKTSADATSPLELLSDDVTIKIPLTQAETVLLKPESRATIFVSVDFPVNEGGRQVFEIKDAYSVSKLNFSFQAAP